MSVTIYDIAKAAGTSTSTVSRVLNGSALIGDELSAKILETAERLGYKKRAIRKQKSRAIINIKLVLGQLSDPTLPLFYSVPELINSLKKSVPDNQVNIICETSTKPEDLFASKKAANIDAVIFAFCHVPKKTVAYLKEAQIPFLALNRELADSDFISYPNTDEMKKLTSRVIKAKNSKSAIFIQMNKDLDVTIERRNGFLQACAELQVDAQVETLKSLADISEDFIQDLHQQNCQAVVCMNDIIATSFIMRSQQSCYQVPRDFSVSGFDGSSITAVLPKKLCTVKLDMNTLGEKSGEWILERVINRSESPCQIKLPGQFISGETL
ncbi:LacI family DNA-binding transcriptional regulator [Lentisphaera profundi]|uniref:LacI family DNA-binding transcriptional regulator n=1 Tax=Lentisphaera profundi TaxID=1658616 RepID=A0ABY7VU04_9BACT|nr:LacI family DNA-binding transcriptional regulator [Lentisphaera profundi]WDE96234.1 LacI family DNA-binding transcriptional regulator [Lentisphaera profundi]